MQITIVRVGTRKGEITLEAAQAFKEAESVILHTARCGCAEWLTENGIAFSSLDEIYEQAEDFDALATRAAQTVMAQEAEKVCYGVLDLADESIKGLMKSGKAIRVLGGGDAEALVARAEGPVMMMSAMDIGSAVIHATQNTIVREIDSRALAGEVKLKLMDHYPDQSTAYFLNPDGSIAPCKLCDLDRLKAYDHRCACLAPAIASLTALERFDFEDLMRLVKRLRDPFEGCPWDSRQTHETLKRDALEEAYELEDAINSGSEAGLIEELGDVLFCVALQIQIGVEHGEFTAQDVISGVVEKMIFRHRHVFGNETAANMDELMRIWNDAKSEEKSFKDVKDEMRAVAQGFPALLRARKVLKRAFAADEARARKALETLSGEGESYRLLELVNAMREKGVDAEEALQRLVEKLINAY